MRLLKEDSALLIIDIQERIVPHMAERELLIANTQKLIQGFKILTIPIVVSEQYRKGLGLTIPEILNCTGEINVFEKISFSCCDDKAIMGAISAKNKKNIIICGIETHVCVLQTAMDLLEKGMLPVIVADCVSSRKETDKDMALRRMEKAGVIITSSESLLFELTRFAGTDTFKTISKLVK
jgi:nicotinamidase-related amidase